MANASASVKGVPAAGGFEEERRRVRGQRTRRLLKPYLFIAPWLLGVLIFYAYPIVASLYFSFNNYDVLRPPVWIGLENYKTLIENYYSRQALTNTLIYVAFAVPFGLFTGLLYAVLLNTRIRGQQAYRTLMMLPAAIPIAASAAIWVFLWNPAYGLVNSILATVGLPWRQTWIASPAMVKWIFITMQIVYGLGILVFLAGLQGVPTEVYDAAKVDGATGARQFFYITIPLLTPYILYNMLIGLIAAFQYFTFPMLMTKGGPSGGSTFYGQFLYDQAFTFFKMGYASALAWVLFLICIVVVVLILRSSASWVHYTSGGE
jgi:multiple sugar transport system permease protein